ncbi:MAG: UDP-glucose 4-epimerase GalE [Myxococcales bacterium]|nr:UDP-glucose 4-epimerase GalE [Myxococcales bacterium]
MTGATILVTGAGGYIGSQTVLALQDAQHRVVGLDDLTVGRPELLELSDRVLVADCRDTARLRAIFEAEDIAGVVHCAALAVVAESVAAPTRYLDVNVGGLLNVLGRAVEHGGVPVVFSSSGTVYGDPTATSGLLAEGHAVAPVHAYGLSKRIGEQALAFENHASGLRSVALRYFNAAGADLAGRAGEWHQGPESRVLPRLLGAAQRGLPFELAGDDFGTPDGTCVRDFVHVVDVARAHLQALDYLRSGGPSRVLNIGAGLGTSVLQLVAEVERVTGKTLPLRIGPRRPGDVARLVADVREADATLGWRPELTLGDIVKSAASWHAQR